MMIELNTFFFREYQFIRNNLKTSRNLALYWIINVFLFIYLRNILLCFDLTCLRANYYFTKANIIKKKLKKKKFFF